MLLHPVLFSVVAF